MSNFNNCTGKPHLQMVIEPETKIRFRYESEGGSHGGLIGKQKVNDKKTYPTVKLIGYTGGQRVYIKVSLYTEECEEHVLEFKGRHKESFPFIKEYLQDDDTAVFTNLKILSKKKDEICMLLMDRKLKRFRGNISRAVRTQFEKQYDKELKDKAKKILNSVRLCFEAFEENKPNTPLCEPLFSDLISNQKAASRGELRIHRMSKIAGTWKGGEEVILLCGKVDKDNIKIEFYETDLDEHVIWEQPAVFSPADVHYQVAITFKTPQYKTNTEKTVFVRLARDGETSEPREFTFKADYGENPFKKRKTFLSNEPVSVSSPEEIFSESSPGSSNEASVNIMNVLEPLQNGEDINNFLKDAISFLGLNMTEYNEIKDYSLASDDLIDPPESMNYIPESMNYDPIKNQCLDIFSISVDDIVMDIGKAGRPIRKPEGQMSIGKLEGQMGSLKIKGSENECEISFLNQSSANKCKTNKPLQKNCKQLEQIQNRMSSYLRKRDNSGNTLLHIAAYQNKDVKIILKVNQLADNDIINVQNCDKETALHIATKQNNLELVKTLLNYNSNPYLKDDDGNNCYHIACQNNFVDVLHCLLNHVEFVPEVDTFNYEGLTPLHIAVIKNFENCYHSLTHYADVNLLEKKGGKSLLHYAVQFQPSFVGILLCDEEIDVNVQDFEGNTPLHIACAIENIEVVKKLLEAGADPLLKNFKQLSGTVENYDDDNYGQTPADLTANSEILEILTKASSSVSGSDERTVNLCNLLDVDERWKILATYFMDERFINSLECSTSPTKALLLHIQKEEKENYIQRLIAVLEMAGLNDALEIIMAKNS